MGASDRGKSTYAAVLWFVSKRMNNGIQIRGIPRILPAGPKRLAPKKRTQIVKTTPTDFG